jgi:hypothetical protein
MTSINTHTTLTADALRGAFDARDAEALTSLYADDAIVEIADTVTTPSHPRRLAGRDEIRAHHADIFSRDMTHEVVTVAIDGDRAGFSVRCRYPDGVRVVCVATAELSGGLISRQLTAQAWDA